MSIKEAPAPAARSRRSRPPLPTRARSRGQIFGGLLVIVIAMLAGAAMLLNAGDRTAVIAVRTPIAAGQVIERTDLQSMQVAGVTGAIPVDRVDDVVGKTAATDLVAGQVLNDRLLTSTTVPAAGKALIGLSLTAAQVPAEGITAGDPVQVLGVPAAETGAGQEMSQAETLASEATVFSLRTSQTGGSGDTVVTVEVPQADASTIAAYAAAGRAALIRMPEAGAKR